MWHIAKAYAILYHQLYSSNVCRTLHHKSYIFFKKEIGFWLMEVSRKVSGLSPKYKLCPSNFFDIHSSLSNCTVLFNQETALSTAWLLNVFQKKSSHLEKDWAWMSIGETEGRVPAKNIWGGSMNWWRHYKVTVTVVKWQNIRGVGGGGVRI